MPARRLTISRPRQAQPLADLEFPHPHPAGLGVIRLAEHGIRLAPDTLHVWSVTLALEPGIPSRDLVGSALIEHRPASPALESALRNAAPEQLPFLLAEAGYWYDAVALAERNRASDRGVALSALFRQAELRM